MIGWWAYVDAGAPGRCYQGRNAVLLRVLKETGRLTSKPAQIVYKQAGLGGPTWPDCRLRVCQCVTYVSQEAVKNGWISDRERQATVRWCADADLVLAHYPVHAAGLVDVGVDQTKIMMLPPAATIPRRERVGEAPERPRIVGYAGQKRNFKRVGLAELAATEADAIFDAAHALRPGDMSDWYDKIGVLVLPSLCESAGIVVQEALARGTPVVVTDRCGSADEVRKTGAGLVVGDDRGEFIAAVREVLDNPVYRERAWAAQTLLPEEWAVRLINLCEDRCAQSKRACSSLAPQEIPQEISEVRAEAEQWLRGRGHEPDLAAAPGKLAANWREKVGAAGADPGNWYADDQVSALYVEELAGWHSGDALYPAQAQAFARHARGKVLDFGGGIGTLSIMMARAGLEVDYHDVGPLLREFAVHRFTERGLGVRVVAEPRPPYDSIVAVDVIEHLANPAAFVTWAHGALNPGGRLLLTWVFHDGGNHPQHCALNSARAGDFFRALQRYFGDPLHGTAVHQNGWPAVFERK
uniref:Putative glycosyltransferase n=1 Tax=viral metagenome TaxID=1070528 RepID=A0A6M3M7Y5_9ZZZZ